MRTSSKMSFWKRYGALAPVARNLDFLQWRLNSVDSEKEKENIRDKWNEERKSAEFLWASNSIGKSVWNDLVRSVELDSERLVVTDFFWNIVKTKEYLRLLDTSEITEFILTDTSTTLMRNLHYFDECGWKIAGCAYVEDKRFGVKNTIQGLLIKRDKRG